MKKNRKHVLEKGLSASSGISKFAQILGYLISERNLTTENAWGAKHFEKVCIGGHSKGRDEGHQYLLYIQPISDFQ